MKKIEYPKISVLIPAYNAGKYIKMTLNSVIQQTIKPYEIIVLDDGSTDNTVEIVESYNPKITLLKQKNKGVAAARNFLIKISKGDLIAFIDADDLWHKQYLEVQLNQFLKYPNAVCCMSGYETIREESKSLSDNRKREINIEKIEVLSNIDFINLYHIQTSIAAPGFSIWKKSTLQTLQNGLIPEELRGAEDIFLFYMLAMHGGTFTIIRSFYGGYRLSANSLSQDRLKIYRDRIISMQLINKIYEKLSKDTEMNKTVENHLTASYRLYSKYLMGVNSKSEAKRYLITALKTKFEIKTILFLIIICLPKIFQPKWPDRYRDLNFEYN